MDEGGWFDYVPPSFDAIQPVSVDRALWRWGKTMPSFVWDSAVLEGNAFTYPEVQTLMDGVTVGGHTIHDEDQVLALSDSARTLDAMVRSAVFSLTKQSADALNAIVSRRESLEPGHFRGEGNIVTNVSVNLGERGTYQPPATQPGGHNLVRLHTGIVARCQAIAHPFERAVAYNLAMCRLQAYYDGDRRTARLMMNGELMAHGYDAVSVPAKARLDYNMLMVDFYATGDGTRLMKYMRDLWVEQNG